MRKTINISVPESMFSFIHEKGQNELYGSVSEYIRALVRRDCYRDDYKKRSKTPVRRVNDVFMSRDERLMKNDE